MSWPLVKLGEVFEISRGGSPRPIKNYITTNPDGVNWISIKDASNSNKYITKTKLKIKREGVAKSREVKPGDFLLTNSMSFGRPYIMKTSGCIHDGWLVLSSDPEKIDTEYFYHLLGSETMYRKFSGLAAGAVVKNLNINLVKNVEVVFPSLKEQKRIAAILDKADGLRRKRQQAIELADEFLRAVFLDMFGDPITNPKGWDVFPMVKLANSGKHSIKAGPFGSSIKKEEYVPTGYKIYGQEQVIRDDLTYGDYYIDKEKYRKLETCKVSAGDMLISLVGTFGKISVVPEEFEPGIINPRLMKIAFDEKKALPLYMKYLFSTSAATEKIAHMSHGGTMCIVNVGIIKELELPIPPVKMQKRFLLIQEKLKEQVSNQRVYLNGADSLFGSVSQKAFSSEL